MSSTFGSLNIAKTGLQYQQIAIDTANNNIANVNTEGYVRRRAVAAEVGSTSQPVMWSTDTGHGEGVATQGVQRLSDVLMDGRVRKEHASLSYLQVQQTSLERVETAVGEPSDTGVSAALSAFGDAWQDVVTSAPDSSARQSVIAAGQTLAAAITNQARSIDAETAQQRSGALQDVKDVNSDAQQLAQLNHNIFIAQANGTDAGALMDQRDQVALDLANKAGAVITVDPSTGRYDASVNGVALVHGDKAGTLNLYGVSADGSAGNALDPTAAAETDPPQLRLTITDPDTQVEDTAHQLGTVSGDLGGIQALVNVTLSSTNPAGLRYQLNQVAQNLATVVNAQHEAGFDQDGQKGAAFFTFDAADPAGSLTVAVTDPRGVAASAVPPTSDPSGTVTNNDATNADRLSAVLTGAAPTAGMPPTTTAAVVGGAAVAGQNIGDQYQRMVTGLGATAAGLNTQATNQQMLTDQVDDERDQTAGVSLDEETINLMQAQRAYEASSRVLSVMNSILDTLINHTGV